jgi:hypothetical protein
VSCLRNPMAARLERVLGRWFPFFVNPVAGTLDYYFA